MLVELFRQSEAGKLDLDEVVVLKAEHIVPGSGVLQQLTPGSVRMTLQDVATLMVTVSDNTATNMIIERVGMENVTETMAELGLPDTKLQRKMMDTEAWMADRENLSTPLEQAKLLAMVHHAIPVAVGEPHDRAHRLGLPGAVGIGHVAAHLGHIHGPRFIPCNGNRVLDQRLSHNQLNPKTWGNAERVERLLRRENGGRPGFEPQVQRFFDG